MKNNTNSNIKKYILPIGICASLVSISLLSQATDDASMGVVQNVMKSITNMIKTDGKRGLQILSVAAGGLGTAKTLSWQPLLIAAGGAGIIEVLFQAIS